MIDLAPLLGTLALGVLVAVSRLGVEGPVLFQGVLIHGSSSSSSVSVAHFRATIPLGAVVTQSRTRGKGAAAAATEAAAEGGVGGMARSSTACCSACSLRVRFRLSIRPSIRPSVYSDLEAACRISVACVVMRGRAVPSQAN